MAYFILDSIYISSLLKAYGTFDDAIKIANTAWEQDGAIQRFAYTYELFWKILKKVLEIKGKVCNSPRDVFREAALQGLIDDLTFWFAVIKKCNLTVHNYERKIAETIYNALPAIRDNMLQVIERIKALWTKFVWHQKNYKMISSSLICHLKLIWLVGTTARKNLGN